MLLWIPLLFSKRPEKLRSECFKMIYSRYLLAKSVIIYKKYKMFQTIYMMESV